jgi:arylsulfatase A-like enzyme
VIGLFQPCGVALPLAVLAMLAGSAAGPAAEPAAAVATHPGIVLILADDLGAGDLRCYNPGSKIPTPHADRLAAEGMRFTDMHSPSSVCTPTRYGLLTGRYGWRTTLQKGTLEGYDPLLIETNRLTLAALLQRAGYDTACIGKWHLGLGSRKPTDYSAPLRPGPREVGFDYFFGIAASLDMPPYVFLENDGVTAPPTNRIGASQMRRNGGAGFWRAGDIAPGFRHEDVLPSLTEKAVTWLRQRGPGRPFFLYLPLNAPHTPWMPVASSQGRSGAGYYGDFVSAVDDTIGRVRAVLAETGLEDNTLFIVTSDNGAHWLPSDIGQFRHRANAWMRGQKGDLWEGGHRVPFIARWPGRIRAGAVVAELLCLTDVMATVADLVGQTLPREAAEDSFSFAPLLRGQLGGRPVRPSIVHHSVDGTFAIREGFWKLCLGLGSHGFSEPRVETNAPGGPLGQLYDLASDREERTNLWSRNPALVSRLTQLLEQQKAAGRTASR